MKSRFLFYHVAGLVDGTTVPESLRSEKKNFVVYFLRFCEKEHPELCKQAERATQIEITARSTDNFFFL